VAALGEHPDVPVLHLREFELYNWGKWGVGCLRFSEMNMLRVAGSNLKTS
jgi:hypothetical protein